MNDVQPNGSGEIRVCLIGGFRECGSIPALPERSSGVPRCSPYVSPDGSISSLDMVRLELKFRGDDNDVAALESSVQNIECDTYRQYDMVRSQPGAFAHLYTLGYGESTVTLGVGQFVKGAKADMNRGFLEFNPNKLGTDAGFLDFLGLIAGGVRSSVLGKYDFAVDIPVPRSAVLTRKDRRRYEFVQGKSLTEYLGARNRPGRVKVYDKAEELKIRGAAITRIELTCGGDWGVDRITEHWPVVFCVGVNDEVKTGLLATFIRALAEIESCGGGVEQYLGALDHHTRKKVREGLEGVTYPCPELGAAHVYMNALRWASSLCAPE